MGMPKYYRKTFKVGLIFLVIWVILSAGFARAEQVEIHTGIGLLKPCEDKTGEFACEIFLAGWRYGFFVGRMKKGENSYETEFNFPDRPSWHQIRLVVLKYLRAHPEELHKPSYWLIKDALVEAFPWQPEK